MRYKEDWELTKKRFTAFWDGEILDRCCISVKATDNKVAPLLEPFRCHNDQDIMRYRTTPELIIAKNRLLMEHTYYAGESFPSITLDLGASGHAGFFKGADYKIGDTVWFFPSLTDLEDLEFDENSYLYQKTLEMARVFAQDSNGDYIVSMPDSTGNADALAHLFGTEELFPAMLEEPEAVKIALDKIQCSYEKVMRNVYDIVRDANDGGSCVGWLRTWAPGFHAQMQCDLSVMISNPLFKEFIMPELQAQCKLLDYPLYHFDGVEQIRHLDDLLSIPNLRVIQWTQVAGQAPCTEYFDVLRRIQAAGKNLIIHVDPQQIRPVMENLSSKGLFLLTGASTRDEADAIVKEVARLTHE